MPTCRSCPAEVIFVPSAKSGKNMILDARPTKGVVLVARSAGDEELWRAEDAKYFDESPVARVVDVYTDHHATCPRAEDWR
jgi:hypothetical protein